jgi:hypothetical protein
MPRSLPTALLLVLSATAALARVVSYAPYTDRVSVPAVGSRFNRHFALVETSVTQSFFGSSTSRGQIVLYDSKGQEEPRVIFPQDSSEPFFDGVAVREPLEEPAMILAVTSPPNQTWNLSTDSGRTWKKLAITERLVAIPTQVDVGGFIARNRYSSLRVGNRDYPFVAVSYNGTSYHLLAIGVDGSSKELMTSTTQIWLAGFDLERRRFLVRSGSQLSIVDTNGTISVAGVVADGYVEGWITPSGAAYVEHWKGANDIALWLHSNGTATFIAGTVDKTNPNAALPPYPTNTQNPFFAVPMADYNGAWIVKRTVGGPTQLFSHSPQRALIEHWSDITAPEVEAIHPALNGSKLLIQVHRPRRASDQLLFKDPALAVWSIGDQAPRFYDELYLAESSDKGFVHLDVDNIETGAPFVFDSGRTNTAGPILSPGPVPSPGGGSDVVQEWGVVRGSLTQRLVVPGFGRTPGAFGSLWRSDLTLDNPSDAAVNVTLRFVAAGDAVTAAAATSIQLRLAAHETRLIADAAKELFGIESATGSLFIEPEGRAAINATGRTYTQSSKGTYGYGMNAIDVFAATSARFPVTFSGAFQGSNFRTNLFLTDVSGRGTAASFDVSGPYGTVETSGISTETSASGVLQRNSLGFLLALPSQAIGSLTVRPTRGEAIASIFSVDNRTNDPTFYPPDLSVGTVRTIPVVGHLDGANGSQFRSDLFLYNLSAQTKSVSIEMRSWTSPNDQAFLNITLLPREARMIPDVLFTAFNRTGQARLRIGSQGSALDSSVRVTSRTYTVDANGGTYGFLMPPLNSFQTATTGDTLEILGTALDNRFRTNIGLVDVTATFSSSAPRARIEIIGTDDELLDSFETSIPSVGGTQLNDVFRARSLRHDALPVMIRITPLQGMIGAYAAMVDNESNDPTYFAANLGAK